MVQTLRVADPDRRYKAVRLCADLAIEDREFVRQDGGWVLELPPAKIARLEYQLELVDRHGRTKVVCDPDNAHRVPGPFGEKSVAFARGYRPPDWLDAPAASGTRERLSVRILGRELPVEVWSPGGGALPLLIAHDGPEYDELAGLTRYAGVMIEREVLAPFRVALLPPGERDEWYSASAHYGRALCTRVIPQLRAEVEVAGAPVGIGASLGALAMLHAQRRWPRTFAGLMLQSGSFFVPRFDAHEHPFPRYGRVVRFVREGLAATSFPDPVPVAMTCGSEEENLANNRLMASALAAQGYSAALHEVADLHNYTGWRDALHPHLTDLLTRAWGAH